MDNAIFFVVVAVVFIYMIVRQFADQRVTPLSLLLLPLLSAYASYTDLELAFARFAVLPIIGGVVVGVLAGVATGVFRGWHTRVRLDSASGTIYSKPRLSSSMMWLLLLILRIAVSVLPYFNSLSHNLLLGVLVAFGGTTFLLSISTQKWMVFTQYYQYRMSTLQGGRGDTEVNL